uniref:Pyrin domain-containing protein n=1 Tax=Cyprinodon variegatus TaxID=28743 RepID=A0A3Q2DM45_CYPVA
MCSEEILVNILDELVKKEFIVFKWHLKRETWNGTQPIKPRKLERAKRLEVVDLMVQKYHIRGAAVIMGIILKKMSRNDLVKKIKQPQHNLTLYLLEAQRP